MGKIHSYESMGKTGKRGYFEKMRIGAVSIFLSELFLSSLFYPLTMHYVFCSEKKALLPGIPVGTLGVKASSGPSWGLPWCDPFSP